MPVYERKYSDKVSNILKNIKLNEEQEITLSNCMNELPRNDKTKLKDIFEDMYKLYISDISTSDIANIYHRNIRTIQLIFKKLGLERDKLKAQSIAVKKRDYKKIRETYKQTMLDRITDNQLYGSEIEQYVRQQLALILNSKIKEIGGEAIIGVNTVTSVGELDIPVIILLNNKYYKYGIEVDGIGFHKERRTNWANINDTSKEKELNDIGYKILRIESRATISKGSNTIKYLNSLKKSINDTINKILKDFH